MPAQAFPLRHLSIRVPWHDSGWVGTVCKAPHLNAACAKLKGIAQRKNDDALRAVAGERIDELPFAQRPPCVDERSTFMAPWEMDQLKRHALAAMNPEHYGHFQPTHQRYPAYSAGIVPFRWMMVGNMAEFRDGLDLDVDPDREPDLGYDTNWVHEYTNQAALLDGFRSHLQEEASLCFFYAKHVPFVEATDRILVGVGRAKSFAPLVEYERSSDGMRGVVWERPVQHSIRPLQNDGFLLPYAELVTRLQEDPTLDGDRFACRAPSENWDEFSFGSELVTHDGAIGALIAIDGTLSRYEAELGIATTSQRAWVHDELSRLWRVRGPFPGLGAILTAFGLSRGMFIAHALQGKAGENANPWPLVDQAFREPTKHLPKALQKDLKELSSTWKGLSDQRRSLLQLLSRFELSNSQAKTLYEQSTREETGILASDAELIANPYRVFENSRHHLEMVHLVTVDRGIFPEDVVRLKHPLEAPSQLESALDARRVRAFAVARLEDAAEAGHTLLPTAKLVQAIAETPASPSCPVTGDTINAHATKMMPEVAGIIDGERTALQLARYQDIGTVVRKNIEGRVAGKRHIVQQDWVADLNVKFGISNDPEEMRARAEKISALTEMAESRFSVLAGPAGAGKTSVLSILCATPEIRDSGLLLLAPTGKARVRMQELVGREQGAAQTVAQFLNANGRYDGATGRYFLSDRPKATGFGTVIVDEASMLTEDMLGALFDALHGVSRFILVGDPAQLPPIGAGRPFVDIVARLRPENWEATFPRVAKGYVELTIERRQLGMDRPDLRLARWFSTSALGPAEDDVFYSNEPHQCLGFVEWRDAADFQDKLMGVLRQELELSSDTDIRGFNQRLGATSKGEYDYFNSTRNDVVGAAGSIENWQILSPLRGQPFGVTSVNRQIHEKFRRSYLELASRRRRSIPKPLGEERIVYGDKVINLRNHRRGGKRVYPKEGALEYLANGEIGVSVGLWKNFANPGILKVEFSSQSGYTYDFYSSDFREEGNNALELAYALTVHKAQGSQFKLVILVVPEGHPILTRELIYTGLTRHQHRVIVMHQGPRSGLKDLAAPHRSDTARRMTNLMRACEMVEIPLAKGSAFLQKGLVHHTSRGIPVRSKSELVIAEALENAGISFVYEKELTLGGRTRLPDFTIEDEISGRTVFWEHLGLLERESYRRDWERKLGWYRDNGVTEADGGGPAGLLITTTESSSTGFDARVVRDLIKRHFG